MVQSHAFHGIAGHSAAMLLHRSPRTPVSPQDTARQCHLETAFGTVELRAAGRALTALTFLNAPAPASDAASDWRADPVLGETARQLAEFARGARHSFDLPLALSGTPFQTLVWDALAAIPFGATCTYAELAQRIGRPTAQRAVGAAVGRNPIGWIVPCHRVVGARGRLTGYAGGLDRKAALLEFEAGRAAGPLARLTFQAGGRR